MQRIPEMRLASSHGICRHSKKKNNAVPREVLRRCMRKRNTSEAIVRLVQDISVRIHMHEIKSSNFGRFQS